MAFYPRCQENKWSGCWPLGITKIRKEKFSVTFNDDVFSVFIQLHSNPWNCDCHLKNFRDWVVFRGLYTYPTSCAEPERLADKLWQDVDPKDFACKPDIQVPQSVVFSQPGANVTLSCFIIGNPMPDAKWVLKVRNTMKESQKALSVLLFWRSLKNLSLEYFSPRSV